MNRGSLLKAALLGGLLSALLSAVPLIGILCCAWVTGGGVFAAWVLASDSGRQAGGGRLALAGWLSGVIGGVVGTPLIQLSGRLQAGEAGLQQQAEEMRRQLAPTAEQLSPETVEAMVQGFTGLSFNLWTVMMMIFISIVFSILGLFGGLVGGALFGAAPPTEPPPVPPLAPAPPEPGAGTEERELEPDELPPLPPGPREPPASEGEPGGSQGGDDERGGGAA